MTQYTEEFDGNIVKYCKFIAHIERRYNLKPYKQRKVSKVALSLIGMSARQPLLTVD